MQALCSPEIPWRTFHLYGVPLQGFELRDTGPQSGALETSDGELYSFVVDSVNNEPQIDRVTV